MTHDKHTPGPWTVSDKRDDDTFDIVREPEEGAGWHEVATGLTNEDAKFIVRAVNNHEQMLDTLRAIFHLLTGDEFEEYPSTDLENDIRTWAKESLKQARKGVTT